MIFRKATAIVILITFLCSNSALAQNIRFVPVGPNIPDNDKTVIPSTKGLQRQDGGPLEQVQSPSTATQRLEGMIAPGAALPQSIQSEVHQSPAPVVEGSSAAPPVRASSEELSDIEKYVAGISPETLTFDIKQFGYDLFLSPPSTFAPVENVPVGSDYVIGPGDEVRINVWGGIEFALTLQVDRDGTMTIPKIGTIGVAGLKFEELKQTVHQEISKSYTDFQMNISMGQLRSIRVYVVGNAKRPGAYTISSLSTLINALFHSGGPSKVGSMRNIQLVRGGKPITQLDLYDFILNGSKANDMRLMPEDVIVIPPIGPIVGVAGNVKSPAIYELKGRARIQDVIKMAGGVSAKAYLQRVQVERVFQNKSKILVDLNLDRLSRGNDIPLDNGDIVKVFPVTTVITNKVSLKGNVYRPGEYEWRQGMRVRDLIKSTRDLMPDTLMDIARIDRLVPPDYHQEYRIVNLGKLLLEGDESENIRLEPFDVVHVLNKWEVRQRPKVRSEGALFRPGEFEFRPNMTLSDLIKLSGGLQKYAMKETAELTRVTPTSQGPETQKIIVSLEAGIDGELAQDYVLQEDDYLFVRSIPEWDLYKLVSLAGEVRHPGKYTIEKGERLSSVIARAGGFTDKAYLRGAVLTRESIKKSQQVQLQDMVNRLERELLASGSADVSAALTAEDAKIRAEEVKQKSQFLESLRHLEAKGRLVISLAEPERLRSTPEDLLMEEGDALYVPQYQESVQVIGAVYNQSAFRYQPGAGYSFYIDMSGGYTRNADKKSLYIMKVDGRATKPKGTLAWNKEANKWGVGYAHLEPGDTIVVPDRLEHVSWLKNIKDVALILGNIAATAGIAIVGLK